MSVTHDKEQTLQRAIGQNVEAAVPGVEVLAVELSADDRFTVFIDHPEGVDHALCVRVTELLADYRRDYAIDVSSPGLERPLRTQAHFRSAVGRAGRRCARAIARRSCEPRCSTPASGRSPSRPAARTWRSRTTRSSAATWSTPKREGRGRCLRRSWKQCARSSARRASRATRSSTRSRTRSSPPTRRRRARARHAVVELDDEGEFRVYSIVIPGDLESRLLEEAMEAKIDELERLEAETGEQQHTLINEDDLDLDWSQVPEEQIERADVTPDNFGRIAAQTAKQVIQQRIREAERAMMYEEYVDRQSEVVTGIVQQAGDRNNVLVDLGKVEALLPRSEQVDGERYEQGSRIKAVITEVRSGTKGPQVILSRRDPGADQDALRARGAGDRRRARRDPRRRARARLPDEDRGRVARPGRRPGRRVRRPARLARPHGRLRAARREDRHHPVEHRARPLRRQGALAGARARGLHRRRHQGGDGRRPERPARARDRQGGPERPPRRAADGLEGRHPVGRGVRPRRGRGGLRRRGCRRRGVHRPLRRRARERQALPERVAPRLEVLRRPCPPGARRNRGRSARSGRSRARSWIPSSVEAEIAAVAAVEAESPVEGEPPVAPSADETGHVTATDLPEAETTER